MISTVSVLLAAAAAPALLPTGVQDPDWTQAELEDISSQIQEHIAELRNEKFKRPVAVKLATAEDFYAYARGRIAESETPEKIAADEQIAKMLGLVPPDMDLMETMLAMLETQVGGYYDPSSDSFSLMAKCPKSIAPVILAHELGHALDDQLFGIDQGLAEVSDVTDASTAYSGVVEGSATNLMPRWMVQYAQWQMMNGGSIDLEEYGRMQQDAQEPMLKAPMIMWKPMFFVYTRGASFLVRSESAFAGAMSKAASTADIRMAFTNPPRSTEQILHPAKYWDPAQRDEPKLITFDTSALPEGWKELRTDRLGELSMAILTTPNSSTSGVDVTDPTAALAVSFTNEAATGWGGDAVILLGKDDARFLRLVTVWDSERDAAEFMGALSSILPALREANAALGEGRDGVTLEYGARQDEVVFTAWFGLSGKDARKLPEALTHAR